MKERSLVSRGRGDPHAREREKPAFTRSRYNVSACFGQQAKSWIKHVFIIEQPDVCARSYARNHDPIANWGGHNGELCRLAPTWVSVSAYATGVSVVARRLHMPFQSPFDTRARPLKSRNAPIHPLKTFFKCLFSLWTLCHYKRKLQPPVHRVDRALCLKIDPFRSHGSLINESEPRARNDFRLDFTR